MGEPLPKTLSEHLEFKKRDFRSGVTEPRQNRAGGSGGGELDVVIIPKSLGILIFQRHFPPCGRGPPRLPRYKTLRVFPGVGSGRRGQLGLGGWVSGENNPDFLPRDFPGRGLEKRELRHPIAPKIPEYPRPFPRDFCCPRGWWLLVHPEGGKSGDDNSQISVQGWKGAWFEKYFGKQSPKLGMRACSQLGEMVEFCSWQEKRLPRPRQSLVWGGGGKSKIEEGAKINWEVWGGKEKESELGCKKFQLGAWTQKKFQLEVWLQKNSG